MAPYYEQINVFVHTTIDFSYPRIWPGLKKENQSSHNLTKPNST